MRILTWDMTEINNYAKKIRQVFHPEKIILFGSYAYGNPGIDSDIDLLVVINTKLRPIEQAVLIRKRIPSSFPLDLIVRTSQQVRERLREGDYFLKTIFQKGKEL